MKINVNTLINDIVDDDLKDIKNNIPDKEKLLEALFDFSTSGETLDEYDIRDSAIDFSTRYAELRDEISETLDRNPKSILAWLADVAEENANGPLKNEAIELSKSVQQYMKSKKTISKIMDLNSIKQRAHERGKTQRNKQKSINKGKNRDVDR